MSIDNNRVITSTKIQVIRPDLQGIPQELKERPQWVLWQGEWLDDGRLNKVPYSHKHYKASTIKPADWTSFERAAEVYQTSSEYHGLGYVFSENDPYVGIDLDKCRDPDTGKITEAAQSIINEFCTYAEVSPSGTGAKLMVAGTKLGKRCKNTERGIEIYKLKRFFTVTGKRVENAPASIAVNQPALDALYTDCFPNEPTETHHELGEPRKSLLTDLEVFTRVCSHKEQGEKFYKLWMADLAYMLAHYKHKDGNSPDLSRVDLALCDMLAFWCGGDCEQIERMMWDSHLSRPKWSKNKGYMPGTITKAIERCKGNFYRPPADLEQRREQQAAEALLAVPLDYHTVQIDEEDTNSENLAEGELSEPSLSNTGNAEDLAQAVEVPQASTDELSSEHEADRPSASLGNLTSIYEAHKPYAVWADMRAMVLNTDDTWIVPLWLQAGRVAVMPADAKAGKTTFALWLSNEVIFGGEALGQFVNEDTPVAYYDYENPLDFMLNNVDHFRNERDEEHFLKYFYYRNVSLQDEKGHLPTAITVEWMREEIAILERLSGGKKGIIWIDTMRGAFAATKGLKPGWESDPSTVAMLLRPFGAVSHQTGWTIVFLHHNNRLGLMSGSAEIMAAVDCILTYNKEDGYRKLSAMGRYRIGGAPKPILLDLRNNRLELVGTVDEEKTEQEDYSLLHRMYRLGVWLEELPPVDKQPRLVLPIACTLMRDLFRTRYSDKGLSDKAVGLMRKIGCVITVKAKGSAKPQTLAEGWRQILGRWYCDQGKGLPTADWALELLPVVPQIVINEPEYLQK